MGVGGRGKLQFMRCTVMSMPSMPGDYHLIFSHKNASFLENNGYGVMNTINPTPTSKLPQELKKWPPRIQSFSRWRRLKKETVWINEAVFKDLLIILAYAYWVMYNAYGGGGEFLNAFPKIDHQLIAIPVHPPTHTSILTRDGLTKSSEPMSVNSLSLDSVCV